MTVKNKYKILISLITVFAAAFFIINSVFASGAVFSLKNGEEITSITIDNEYGIFFFFREADDPANLSSDGIASSRSKGNPGMDDRIHIWFVETEGIRYRTNAPKMTLLLESLSSLPVKRVLESERDGYGLAFPVAHALLKTNAGRRYEYSFGNTGTDVNTVYTKNTGGSVILTDTFAFNQVTGNLAAYRDKNVFSVDLLDIDTLEYGCSGQLTIVCRKEGPTEWYMDYPWKVPARHIELTELIAHMAAWGIGGYPEAVDQKEAGLDPPLETLVLVDAKGNRQKLDFGKTDGLYRYVQIGGQGDVVFLYAVDVDFSVLSAESLLFIAPLRTQMGEVSTFSVKSGANVWTLSYDQLSDTAFWDYGLLDNEEFVSIFFKFISMVADGYDTGILPQLGGKPIAVMSLKKTDNGSAKLELFPRDKDTYFMRINGDDTPYFINAVRLSNLLDRITDLEARKLIKTSLMGETGGKT